VWLSDWEHAVKKAVRSDGMRGERQINRVRVWYPGWENYQPGLLSVLLVFLKGGVVFVEELF